MLVVQGGRKMMGELFCKDAVTEVALVSQFVSRGHEYWQGKIDQKVLRRGDQLIRRLWPENDILKFKVETYCLGPVG
jgi:hypothetical protein